jgi:hypothetical protein
MPLSVDQLEVVSFSTTESMPPAQRFTEEVGCYSPFCMPTALPEQCPDTGTVAV